MATERVERVSGVQAFAYRVPRFAVTLPVEFLVKDGAVAGVTKNISERGLLVQFASPVLPETTGTLRLMIDTCAIEVEAEVTYAELFEAGLRFCFASQAEQRFVQMLVKVVARNASHFDGQSSLSVRSR